MIQVIELINMAVVPRTSPFLVYLDLLGPPIKILVPITNLSRPNYALRPFTTDHSER